MNVIKEVFLVNVRKAIDDILPAGVSDSFSSDTDDELWQAALYAATELSLELPLHLLTETPYTPTTVTESNHGGCAVLPSDFARFVGLDVKGWAGTLYELIEPGSEAEKMQRSIWSRGTATKPKAMLSHKGGQKAIVWWPIGTTPVVISYIKVATETAGVMDCAIRQEAYRLLVYRAASTFFEGKKEDTIAEKFRSLSTNY